MNKATLLGIKIITINENNSNSLVFLAINGVEELLEFLSGEDPVGKVSVELFKRQLAII